MDEEIHKWFMKDKPIEFATKEDKYKFYIERLKEAFDDIVWMAIRYANNRRTFAPTIVREACKIRAKFGDFHLKDDKTLDGPTTDGWVCKNDNLRDLLEKYK